MILLLRFFIPLFVVSAWVGPLNATCAPAKPKRAITNAVFIAEAEAMKIYGKDSVTFRIIRTIKGFPKQGKIFVFRDTEDYLSTFKMHLQKGHYYLLLLNNSFTSSRYRVSSCDASLNLTLYRAGKVDRASFYPYKNSLVQEVYDFSSVPLTAEQQRELLPTKITLQITKKQILAIGTNAGILKYSRLAERVNFHKALGNMAVVVTDRGLMGATLNSKEWVQQSFFGDRQYEVKLHRDIAVVKTDRKLYALSNNPLGSKEWHIFSLDGNEILSFKVHNNMAAARSKRRVIFYSAEKKRWYQQHLHGAMASNISFSENKAIVTTNRNTLIFDSLTGKIQIFSQ